MSFTVQRFVYSFLSPPTTDRRFINQNSRESWRAAQAWSNERYFFIETILFPDIVEITP